MNINNNLFILSNFCFIRHKFLYGATSFWINWLSFLGKIYLTVWNIILLILLNSGFKLYPGSRKLLVISLKVPGEHWTTLPPIYFWNKLKTRERVRFFLCPMPGPKKTKPDSTYSNKHSKEKLPPELILKIREGVNIYLFIFVWEKNCGIIFINSYHTRFWNHN